jgi:phosphatidylserine decarboxylase
MFHKEGGKIILIATTLTVVFLLTIDKLVTGMVADDPDAHCIVLPDYDPAIFRNPKRPVDIDDNHVIAPVDGKVVVIEEVFEGRIFQGPTPASVYFHVAD